MKGSEITITAADLVRAQRAAAFLSRCLSSATSAVMAPMNIREDIIALRKCLCQLEPFVDAASLSKEREGA